ncbi:hypothetical protein KFZ70_09710 [Tamlana fucoidanivorans]|uniref:Fibrobacter succinogenes major paralogous domain-containing protein n=1 Tax=Allotamlana fucoidanivorans TaxID=2583814 RepID=A0A5C4SP16_9FLAO|nr:FISUMP domain-containing protein [Tamlana fucoidanivorans]TNJ45858.1 hypothetical protein FGF67_05615 [Tamlana fucoidanivorans]
MKYIRNLFLLGVVSMLAPYLISCEDDDNGIVIPVISVSNVSPLDNAESIGYNPTFTWEASADNFENLKFDFYIGTEENKLGLRAQDIKDTQYKITKNTVMKGGVTYYWKVVAKDGFYDNESEVWSFTTAAPDVPVIESPLDKSLLFVSEGDVLLDWTDSAGPNGETAIYDVFIDTVNPPVNLATSFSGESEFNATSELTPDQRYYWRVVSRDGLGNSFSTETFSFDYLAAKEPVKPELSEEVEDGVLSLDESLVWGVALGANTLDVYIDTVNPPLNKVASDVTGEGYVVQTKDTPSDINDIKTFYAQVVAKNDDGESKSEVISFTPQVTGVYTDVRGSESLDYSWVRIGSQIWMSQNLRTKKLTTGEDLEKIIQPTSADYPITASTTTLYYDEHPADNGPIPGYPSFTAPWSDGDNGRVYSSKVPRNALIAPEGWHVITDTDISTIRAYVPNASDLLDEWYGGTDSYGANFLIAGYRYNNFTDDRPFGFRYVVEEGRVALWINPIAGTNDVWELYPAGNYRSYNQGNEHNRMFGIRLVKD